MHDLHKCISWKPWVLLFINNKDLPSVSFSTFTWLVVSVKNFRNPFFIFHLDTQSSLLIGEPTDVGLWISSSPFFKSPLFSCTPMWVWVYSRDWGPFSYRPSGGFNFSADGCSTCGCLAVFPSHIKGRKNLSLFSLFALGYKSWQRTEYEYSWANRRLLTGAVGLFSLNGFVHSVRFFFK
jgi:hypothetical protein